MPVFLGQLVYTSFPRVGFRLLASTQVPIEVQQAFTEQVVYQHWDVYNPPMHGYRAVYLHQITLKHNLFGWLYNDGLDDLGRNHVPYFHCYYLAERLHALYLENIFTCLYKGPLSLIDRHSPPTAPGTIVAPDFLNYQSARIGVAIPSNVRERSYVALKQRRLLKLFIAVDEQEVATPMPESLAAGQDTIPFFWGNRSQALLGSQTVKTSVPTFPSRPALVISLVAGISSVALALTLGSYYFIRPPAPDSFALKRTSLENVFLAKTLAGHSDSVWSIALNSDHQTLVSGSSDKTIKVWNLNTGQLIRTLSGHTDTVRSVALSSDGQLLASGSGDKTIKLWNLQTGKELRTLSGHSGPIWSIAISRDGQTLVSGSEDSTIKIWNLQTGELRRTLKGHVGRVFSVALSPNGEIASSGIDKTIKIWSQNGELLRTLISHSGAVRAIAISPDGQKLASSSWDKTVKVWNLQTGELLHTFEGHTDRVVSVTFGSDEQIASASIDKTIKIWSLSTGKLVRNLSGHSDWVLCIAVSPSEQTLVSGSKDKTIKIWQPQ